MSQLVVRYKPENINGSYDAIIIGSGMGGLTCGAFLAKAGKRVLMLERHYTPGGFTHVFRRGAYEWDVGLHYIGEVHRPSSFLRMAFDEMSGERLQWASMGDIYDRALFPGGKSYDFKASRQAFLEQMLEYFPKEEKALKRYISLIYAAASHAATFFGEKALPFWI